MDVLFLIGRILFGGYFLLSGLNHFTHRKMLTGYTASKKVPAAQAAVLVTGLLLILGGLGVVLGVLPRIALILILIFLVPTTFIMHNFWKEQGDNRMMERVHFLKNLALVGAALLLLTIPLPWMLSL